MRCSAGTRGESCKTRPLLKQNLRLREVTLSYYILLTWVSVLGQNVRAKQLELFAGRLPGFWRLCVWRGELLSESRLAGEVLSVFRLARALYSEFRLARRCLLVFRLARENLLEFRLTSLAKRDSGKGLLAKRNSSRLQARRPSYSMKSWSISARQWFASAPSPSCPAP